MNYQECVGLLANLFGEPMGMCAEYTSAFAKVFPELKRVRGHVSLRNGWRRSHWWLIEPNGDIFDPTASQFDTEYFGHAGIAFYEPLNESDPEPTGKCPNCGGFCYDGSVCCSTECGRQYGQYLGIIYMNPSVQTNE